MRALAVYLLICGAAWLGVVFVSWMRWLEAEQTRCIRDAAWVAGLERWRESEHRAAYVRRREYDRAS